MNYYTEIVPAEIVERLYKAGCPNIQRYERDGKDVCSEETYASVFDGLMERGIAIYVSPCLVTTTMKFVFNAAIMSSEIDRSFGYRTSWCETANEAIEKAIEILKKRKK